MVFVGFSTPRRWNPLSWLIRVGTHSPASHAWLLVEDPLFKLRLVLEAHTTGFRLVTLARFAKDNEVVLITRSGERRVAKAPKSRIAAEVLDEAVALLNEH